jgi:hypothetical protein
MKFHYDGRVKKRAIYDSLVNELIVMGGGNSGKKAGTCANPSIVFAFGDCG